MYVTEILRLDSTRAVGPIFFSGPGPHEQYPDLPSARRAAAKWCTENDLDEDSVKIVSRIVGCL